MRRWSSSSTERGAAMEKLTMNRIRVLLSLWVSLCLSSLLMTGAALAQPALSAADADSIRSTVASQLSAMAAGDAQRAFSLAVPGIRQQFGNADTFMAMVKNGYPMVIRPAATTYFVATANAKGALQQVRLQDPEGRLWLATYVLARQADGHWRIAGCGVVSDTSSRSI